MEREGMDATIPALSEFTDIYMQDDYNNLDPWMALCNDDPNICLDDLGFGINNNMVPDSMVASTVGPMFCMPQSSLPSSSSHLEPHVENNSWFTGVEPRPQAPQGGYASSTQPPAIILNIRNALGSQLSAPANSCIEMALNSPSSANENGTKRENRGALKEMQLGETNLTRELRACMRCSMQKIRCIPNPIDMGGSCMCCTDVNRKRIHQQPCLRYGILDVELLDHSVCPKPKAMEFVDIPLGESSIIKVVCVTQIAGGTSYDLEVRKPGSSKCDGIDRKGKTNDTGHVCQCMPYAITDKKKAGEKLLRHANATLEEAIHHYVGPDKLLRDTYLIALKHSRHAERDKERKLLCAVLTLWNASRMRSQPKWICSSKELGMRSHSGKILLPWMLTRQVDAIITATILQPAKKEALRLLNNLIKETKQPSWFTIYLTMFILLHNCTLLTQGKMPKQDLPSWIESLRHGAKILLAHFHYCNEKSYPFTLDWLSQGQSAQAELNNDLTQFMRDTIIEVTKKFESFQDIRNEGRLQDDYYFLAQLYDREWRLRSTV